MKDEEKTKEQFLNELGELRQRITELEVFEAKHKLVEKQLKQRIAIEKALAHASRLFISTVDPDLNQILKIFGEVVSANRSYIFLFRENGKKVDNTHEWCDPATEPQIDNLQDLDSSQVPWWIEKLESRENIIIPNVSALPQEATAEKEILQSQSIRSLLVVPIDSKEGRLLGFMGFDDTEKCRTWSDEDIRLLRVASEMISSYLERKKVEDALKESEALYHSLVETSQDLIWRCDAEGKYIFLNKAWEKTHGYKIEEMLGKPFTYFQRPEVAAADIEHFKSHVKRDPVDSIMGYETTQISKSGEEIHLVFNAIPLYDSEGKIIGRQGTAHDITLRKRAEEALKKAHDELEIRVRERTTELVTMTEQLKQEIDERKKAGKELGKFHEQLRNLSAHLQSVREEEREKIAREIHDELGQTLTALKMELSTLANKLYPDHKPLLEKAKSMTKIIDKTIQSVKRICAELRPAILDHFGLPAAIEWHVEEFESRTGIKCDVSIEPKEINIDQDLSTALFRILQEALTNVVRHANATEVGISLKGEEGKIVLKVSDNGKGITKKQISDPINTFGLIGVKERVHYFGGEIEIKGIRNKGTTLIVNIPVKKKEQDL